MNATYRFIARQELKYNEDQIHTLTKVLLRRGATYIDERVYDAVIEDILGLFEVNNLDTRTVVKIINKWNEKVK
jgi:hypothetical protein